MGKKELAKRYILFILGLFFAGIGVAFTKHGELGVSPISSVANVIMNSGKAIVKAISVKAQKEFGNVKVAFDISCVALSIILSLLFFNLKIVGTREGTIISAVLTGFVVKFFTKLIQKPLENILTK